MSSDTPVISAPLTIVPTTSSTTSLTDTTTPITLTTSTSPEISSVTHVRLPGFWHNSPTQWFTHADAMFANKRICSDLTRVNHVLEALDEEGVRTISDLLGPDATYDSIQQRLITAYGVPQATRFQRMIQPGGMGDRTPSRLLRDMRDVYPDGMSDNSLVAFWLSKLPPPVRTVIAGLTGSGDFLAERADRVWEACQNTEISAVSRNDDNHGSREHITTPQRSTPTSSSDQDTRFLALEKAVHALTAQVTALATSQAAALSRPTNDRASRQQRDRSRSLSQPPQSTITAGWCFYHDRYGADARKCRDPCTYVPATRKNP
ncbi:uncharacterized protein LOC132951039 [Metopolophium dirhodum]|uniref:uncharacterized protein LOC132951039 n=1 Tax=Metopolophium dirhodum TaxID=44670 RepID=UPI00298FF0BE|nr:uncharacterized protein LOC132951039 [Metopolophium dirhodum]